jgi:hypothetical protein
VSGGGGGEKRGILHEGAATAPDRKSPRRVAMNVSHCEKLCAVQPVFVAIKQDLSR